jgi:hypothetical protein
MYPFFVEILEQHTFTMKSLGHLAEERKWSTVEHYVLVAMKSYLIKNG